MLLFLFFQIVTKDEIFLLKSLDKIEKMYLMSFVRDQTHVCLTNPIL